MKIFTSPTQQLGQRGEEAAVSFLHDAGYHIVERNTANRFGEIDIVARKGGVTYFFEVKASRASSWLRPAENLSRRKLQKLFRAVEHYCLVRHIREYRVLGILVILGDGGVDRVETIDLL